MGVFRLYTKCFQTSLMKTLPRASWIMHPTIKTFSRCLQNIFKKTFLWQRTENVVTTLSNVYAQLAKKKRLRCLQNVFVTTYWQRSDNIVKWVYLGCIQNVFKQAWWKHYQEHPGLRYPTSKTFSRCLQNIFKKTFLWQRTDNVVKWVYPCS